MKLYVGGIPFGYNDQDLRRAFEAFGEVNSAAIVSDRQTGRSRGFGFVEMANEEDGQMAIHQLNGQEMGGRIVKVEQASERPKSYHSGAGRPS